MAAVASSVVTIMFTARAQVASWAPCSLVAVHFAKRNRFHEVWTTLSSQKQSSGQASGQPSAKDALKVRTDGSVILHERQKRNYFISSGHDSIDSGFQSRVKRQEPSELPLLLLHGLNLCLSHLNKVRLGLASVGAVLQGRRLPSVRPVSTLVPLASTRHTCASYTSSTHFLLPRAPVAGCRVCHAPSMKNGIPPKGFCGSGYRC